MGERIVWKERHQEEEMCPWTAKKTLEGWYKNKGATECECGRGISEANSNTLK